MRSIIRRSAAILLICCMIFSLSACSFGSSQPSATLTIFAPMDSILAVSSLVNKYGQKDSKTVIKINYDDTFMQASKIEAGYDCDIYITTSDICLNWLDADYAGLTYDDEAKTEANPNGNDKIYGNSRVQVFKGTVKDEDGNDVEVIFSAAICKSTQYRKQCQAFIDYMFSDEAKEIYSVGEFEMVEPAE